MKCSAVVFSVVWAISASAASAASLYVSLAGSDTTGKGTLDQPWQTLGYATSKMTGGDTLHIRGGTYAECITDSIPAGSNWLAPTVVQAYEGEVVTLNPAPSSQKDVVRIAGSTRRYIVMSGLTLDGSRLTNGGNCLKITYTTPGEPAQFIRVTNCILKNAYDGMGVLLTSSVDYAPTYCEFLNCSVYGNGYIGNEVPNKHGLYVSTSGNIFDGCTVYSNLNVGIHFYNGRPSDNIVRNCRFPNTPGKDAIGIFGGTNNQIYNNVFYGCNVGVLVKPSDLTDRTLIANNTFYSNGAAILLQDSQALCGSATVENNVVSDQTLTGYGGIHVHTGVSSNSVVVIRNNVIAGTGLPGRVYDAAGKATLSDNRTNLATAGFVNPSRGDFRLVGGSAAVDAGKASVAARDIRGMARPQGAAPDAGAFELGLPISASDLKTGPP